MKYKLYELSERNRDFITNIIKNKKNDEHFVLDDIQEFKLSVSINNGRAEQKITHCQKTYDYSKSYWLPSDYPFEGVVTIDLSQIKGNVIS